MSVMQRQSILRCFCCDTFQCFIWPVFDRDVLTETRTNPYNAKVWPYLSGILLAGTDDWSGIADLAGTPGEGPQKRTGCKRLIIWRNRQLLGTNASDMYFDSGAEDHILKVYQRGPASGPFYAPGDATKTPVVVKPYWYPCLEWGGAGTATVWVKPDLDDIHDYLRGDQGIQGEATFWNLDPGNMVLNAVYDVMVVVEYYKRAVSGTVSGGGNIDWTYQSESDGYAVATYVGIERVS